MLQAAGQDWDGRPDLARRHVEQAARTARHGLDEVRRVVRDLAIPELADDDGGAALPEVLRDIAAQAAQPGGLKVDVAVHGQPVGLPGEVATALLRTARGALANVAEHSRASRATVTLTYQDTSVTLDVLDDGCGFDPAAILASRGDRGRGLAGIRARVAELDGDVVVESAPGEGTALAVCLPLPDPGGQR